MIVKYYVIVNQPSFSGAEQGERFEVSKMCDENQEWVSVYIPRIENYCDFKSEDLTFINTDKNPEYFI